MGTERRDTVFIVGGGPSLKGFNFNLLKGRDVIVVNKAARNVPWAKYFISIDSTFFDKVPPTFLEELQPEMQKIFVANLAPKYMIRNEKGEVVDTRSNRVYQLAKFDRVITSKQAVGVGLDEASFCTGGVSADSGSNSGYCAFQLAIIEGYKKIALLGLDFRKLGATTHYHEGYGVSQSRFEVRLPYYAQGFLIGLSMLRKRRPDILVRNCSELSVLKDRLGVCDVRELLAGDWYNCRNVRGIL